MHNIVPTFLTFILLSIFGTKTFCHEQKELFKKPKSFYEKSVYQLTKPFIYTYAHPASSKTLFTITGYKKQKDYALEFLEDIGAESIQIKTHDNALIDGIYINPKIFNSKKEKAFIKWKALFNTSKYKKLMQILEVNPNASNFEELFDFPKNVNKTIIKRKMGAICLPACGLIYELDAKYILNYLLRGFHVVSINYRGLVNSKGMPNWKGTCLDGKYAYEWLKRELGVNNTNMIISGKSFGCGPAVYTASQSKGANLLIDRGFARLSDVCARNLYQPFRFLFSRLGKHFVEKYYRFPNDELISSVTGKFMLIEAKHDKYMAGQAKKLAKAFIKSLKHLNAQDQEDLINQIIIQVSGGHFGKKWGDKMPSWYSDYESQDKLNDFLKKITK